MPPQIERIRLIGPDGKPYSIPQSQAAAFLRTHPGYQLAPMEAPTAAPEKPSKLRDIYETGSREASSLWQNLAYAPEAIAQSLEQPSTGEERKMFPMVGNPNLPPELRAFGGLGLETKRLIGDPVVNAIDWYTKVARGKVPNAYEQALSVLPESMGAGAAAPILGKLMEESPKAVTAPTTGLRVLLQEQAGAGREPVLLARIARQAKVAEREAAHGEQVAGVERENQMRLGEHAANMDIARQAHEEAVAKAKGKYQQELQDYQQSSAAKKAEHAQAVQKARADWVEKANAARQAKAESARVTAQRSTLERGVETYSEKLRQNIQKTYQTVLDRLNGRWHQLRETPTGQGMKLRDMELNSKAIAQAIEHARETKLVGSPDSIRQFDSLMSWMQREGGGVIDEAAGQKPAALRPITWNEARTHYTALGERLSGGDLPGNVYQAIKEVRNALDKELNNGAMRAGVQDVYSSLKNDWAQFESDWRDTSSVTTKGGSPLARARMAPNAQTLTPQLTGKTGDLVLQRLAKYKDAGASMPLAEGVRRLTRQSEELPRVSVPKEPGKLNLPKEPNLGEPPTEPIEAEFKPPRAPEMKRPKAMEPVPPIDPVAIRRARLLARAGHPASWWDVLWPGWGMEHAALKFNPFLEWVARQRRNELPLPAEFRSVRKGLEPESEVEMVRRGGPGQPPASGGKLMQQTDLVRNLRAQWERQKAAGDPGMWVTGIQLRDATDALNQMQKDAWGANANYQPGPKILSREGGGGANYSKGDLDALKQRWGIQ